jgi:hypothetical protein
MRRNVRPNRAIVGIGPTIYREQMKFTEFAIRQPVLSFRDHDPAILLFETILHFSRHRLHARYCFKKMFAYEQVLKNQKLDQALVVDGGEQMNSYGVFDN